VAFDPLPSAVGGKVLVTFVSLNRERFISQTKDTYSHVMPGISDVAATALEEALS
jgi:hypothetical protein